MEPIFAQIDKLYSISLVFSLAVPKPLLNVVRDDNYNILKR